nr:MAG TPA: hypothetical protein [Caudoviricetes sp.]
MRKLATINLICINCYKNYEIKNLDFYIFLLYNYIADRRLDCISV